LIGRRIERGQRRRGRSNRKPKIKNRKWAAAAGIVLTAGLKVEPNQENVVASRLAGTWEADPALTLRLRGHELRGAEKVRVTFEADPAVAGSVPGRYAAFFKDRPIYLAGRMKRIAAAGPGVNPFVLTVLHGNPHLVYFRERDGDPLGDAESFNVMLARAARPEQDLLFIGGDFNNQPFTAYRRGAAGD
jgi:hypothetical protein